MRAHLGWPKQITEALGEGSSKVRGGDGRVEAGLGMMCAREPQVKGSQGKAKRWSLPGASGGAAAADRTPLTLERQPPGSRTIHFYCVKPLEL